MEPDSAGGHFGPNQPCLLKSLLNRGCRNTQSRKRLARLGLMALHKPRLVQQWASHRGMIGLVGWPDAPMLTANETRN
jgi:hypothetical protein